MFAVIFGLALIVFCVCAALPQVLGWGEYMIIALKGVGPVLAAFIGIVSVSIGFADIQDKKEARKEEADALKAEKEAEKTE